MGSHFGRFFEKLSHDPSEANGSPCGTCGFLIVLGGALGQAFGVCANAFAPADGRVVALNYGCGAHSEVEGGESENIAVVVTDEESWDHVDLSEVDDLPEPVAVDDISNDADLDADSQTNDVADNESASDEVVVEVVAGENSVAEDLDNPDEA
jgi:hypothetical protein